MKVEFNKVKIVNRDGSPKQTQPIWLLIGDAIYDRADTKALDVLSDKVYRSNGVAELEDQEVELLIAMMNNIPFFMWLKEPVLAYLNNLIHQKNKKDGTGNRNK